MRAEFGLVRRHVHVHGAIALASLTREAKIERIFNSVAGPPILYRPPVEHLKQESGSPARGVFFLVCRKIARTHHLVLAVMPPAFAHSDTALGGAVKPTFLWIRKECLQFWRLVARAKS